MCVARRWTAEIAASAPTHVAVIDPGRMRSGRPAGVAVRVGSGRALALEALLQPIGERALRYLREAFLELRTMG